MPESANKSATLAQASDARCRSSMKALEAAIKARHSGHGMQHNENATGSSPKTPEAGAASVTDHKESLSLYSGSSTHEIVLPFGIADDILDDETDPDYATLGLDDLLQLYLTTRQRNNLYRTKYSKLFSSYENLHAECKKLNQEISVERASSAKNEEESRTLNDRVKQLETVLSKCKDTIRASKSQAQQFKDERDAIEKRMQAKSADCIVLQTQCEEFKKRLHEAKKMVDQSDANLALAVAEAKRSLHSALEARDDELVECRESLRLADLKNVKLEQKIADLTKTGSEQIKQLESTVQTLMMDKQCIEEKLKTRMDLSAVEGSAECQSLTKVMAEEQNGQNNGGELNDADHHDEELQRITINAIIPDVQLPPASSCDELPTSRVSGEGSTNGQCEHQSSESHAEVMKDLQSSTSGVEFHVESVGQELPVSKDVKELSADSCHDVLPAGVMADESSVGSGCEELAAVIPHEESSTSGDTVDSLQESEEQLLSAVKEVRRDLATEIDKHLLQLEESLQRESELTKDEYLSLIAELRKTIDQARLIVNSNTENENDQWKIAKLEKVAVDAKVLVLRHESEIMELHRRNIRDRVGAAAQQATTNDHIKRLEGKLVEFAKAEKYAKEQLVHFQNDEKLRTAAQNLQVQHLKDEMETARKSELALRQTLEETKVRCEQQLAMTTAENMAALGQFTEFLQSNQSELMAVLSELHNARQQLAETNDQLDERTYQLEDALKYITDIEERLETSLTNEDELQRQLATLDPTLLPLGLVSKEALSNRGDNRDCESESALFNSDVNFAAGEWPVRRLGVWFSEQGERVKGSQTDLEVITASDSVEHNTHLTGQSEQLLQVENCQRLQMKTHCKPRTVSHGELETGSEFSVADDKTVQSLFDSDNSTQCLDSLRLDLETLKDQFVKQSEKLCLANERLQTLLAENELLKHHSTMLNGHVCPAGADCSATQFIELTPDSREQVSHPVEKSESSEGMPIVYQTTQCKVDDISNTVDQLNAKQSSSVDQVTTEHSSANSEGSSVQGCCSSEGVHEQLDNQLSKDETTPRLSSTLLEEQLLTCSVELSSKTEEVNRMQQTLDALTETLKLKEVELSHLASLRLEEDEKIMPVNEVAEKKRIELEDQVSVLERKLNDKERELEECKAKVESAQESLSCVKQSLISQSEELAKINEAASSETQRLREDIGMKMEQLESKDREIENLISELKLVKDSLQTSVDELDVKSRAVESLEIEVRSSREQYDSQIAQLKIDYDEQLRKEIDSLKSVADSSSAEIEMTKQQVLDKEEAIRSVQIDLEAKIGELKSEIESRDHLVRDLRQEKEDIVAEMITKHANEMRCVESELHTSRAQAEVLRETHEAVIIKYQFELQQKDESAKVADQDHRLETEKSKTSIAKLIADQEEAVVQLGVKDKEIENLICELNLVKDSFQARVKELDAKSQEVESLDIAVKSLQVQYDSQIAQLKSDFEEKLRKEIDSLNSVADSSSAEIERTKQQVLDKEEAIRSVQMDLEAKIGELKSEIESRDQLIRDLRQEKDDIVAELITKHANEMRFVESELHATRAQAEVLRATHEAVIIKYQSELQQKEESTRIVEQDFMIEREELNKKITNLIADHEASVEQYRQRISEMEQGDVELNAQLVAVTEKLSSITEYTNSSEKLIENYQMKLSELTQRLEEMKQQQLATETACTMKEAEAAQKMDSLRQDMQTEAEARLAESALEIAGLKSALVNNKFSESDVGERVASVPRKISENISDWESMCESEALSASLGMNNEGFETVRISTDQTLGKIFSNAIPVASQVDVNLTDRASLDCIARLQSENVKLLERLTGQELTIDELTRRHKKEVEKLRSEHLAVIQEMEEQHNMKTVQLIKDFNTQLACTEKDITNYLAGEPDCCKKVEQRLMSEHRQQITEVCRQLTDREALIQQYESDSQAAEADYQVELDRLNTIIGDLQLELKEQRELVENNDVIIRSTARGCSDEIITRGGNSSSDRSGLTSAPAVVESLQIDNANLQAKISRQADEIRWLKSRDNELQQQVESMRSSRRSPQYSDVYHSVTSMLPEPTELEYLKNILYKYMLGTETKTLAKVICTVVKFTDDQTRKILEREETKKEKAISWSSMIYGGTKESSENSSPIALRTTQDQIRLPQMRF